MSVRIGADRAFPPGGRPVCSALLGHVLGCVDGQIGMDHRATGGSEIHKSVARIPAGPGEGIVAG